MSDYLTATDVTEAFMRLVPTRDVEWSDGSCAAEYALPTGAVTVVWDSHSNPIIVELFDVEHADRVWQELTEVPAEEWLLAWECTLADYPDGTAMTTADMAHLMGA
jgi:hypothetical protein